MPPGEPCNWIVFEAMDPGCSQVGGYTEIARSPDAPTNAFACLEDRDVVPVNGKVPCGRQPSDAGADHQDLSRLATHVFPSLHGLPSSRPHGRVVTIFSHVIGIKGQASFAP